jgi:hypothetical protein
MAILLTAVILRPFWFLYASTFTAMWQRLVSLNISGDFSILGKAMRKRGRFLFWSPLHLFFEQRTLV